MPNQIEIILKFYVTLMMMMIIVIAIMIAMMMTKKLTMENAEITKMSVKKNIHEITWNK